MVTVIPDVLNSTPEIQTVFLVSIINLIVRSRIRKSRDVVKWPSRLELKIYVVHPDKMLLK